MKKIILTYVSVLIIISSITIFYSTKNSNSLSLIQSNIEALTGGEDDIMIDKYKCNVGNLECVRVNNTMYYKS